MRVLTTARSALAEQAEKLAEERAGALAAVRQQATEEQEEAMDALRLESEKLLASIEGAMTRLRDERDTFAEDASVAAAQLAAAGPILDRGGAILDYADVDYTPQLSAAADEVHQLLLALEGAA